MKRRAVTGPVGIRELKNHASEVVRRVREGSVVQISDRGRVVALLVPHREDDVAETALDIARSGRISYEGGKPHGDERGPHIRGGSVSEAIVEDRR